VGYIVDYVVKYQNNYVSSYLFLKNIYDLLVKGIHISSLLNSDIFSFYIDFDEWPSMHTDNDSYMMPYNGAIFDLRYNYRKIFKNPELEPIDEDADLNGQKLYKVSYRINIMPMLGEYMIIGEDGKKEIVN
jgi:hypothetical protein